MDDFQQSDIEQEIIRQKHQLSELLSQFEGKQLEDRLRQVESELKEFFGEEAWGHVKDTLKENGFVERERDSLIEEMESAPTPFARTQRQPEGLNEEATQQIRPLPPQMPTEGDVAKKEDVPYVSSDEVPNWERDHGQSYVDAYTPRPLPPEIELGDAGVERQQDRASRVPVGKKDKAQHGEIAEQEALLDEFESRMRELSEVNSNFHKNLIDFIGVMAETVLESAAQIDNVRRSFRRSL